MKNVKIISIKNATHDVMHIETEKPQGLSYIPGQAVDVALDKPNWEKELRAFTFTSLPSDEYLEFFIKVYPEHKGRSEEHTSELQSRPHLVCRLLLEKKKTRK